MKNKHAKRLKAWIEALRSGDYKQTSDQLYTGKAYCCLGVACDLYLKEKGLKWTKESKMTYGVKIEDRVLETTELPEEIAAWFGLGIHNNPEVLDKDGAPVTLISLNDDRGYSFKKIAKVIEQQLLKESK